jgi:hypothetical protein
MPQTDDARWRPVPVTSMARRVSPRWWPAGLAWALFVLALLALGLCLCASGAAAGYVPYGLLVHPGALPAAASSPGCTPP